MELELELFLHDHLPVVRQSRPSPITSRIKSQRVYPDIENPPATRREMVNEKDSDPFLVSDPFAVS